VINWSLLLYNGFITNTLRKSLQTTSASPCRTQVQPTASFLVCSLIFIEYKSAPGHILHSISLLKMDRSHCKGYQKGV